MVNTNKLKGKIVEKGMTIEELSSKIGMNSSTFYRKLAQSGTTFSIAEATAIIETLEICYSEAVEIFFAKQFA